MREDTRRPSSPPLAEGRTAEVFLWDDRHILKLYRDWCPPDWVEYESRIARAVFGAGIPSPEAGEIVEMDGRRGLIYERLEGMSMLQEMSARPWTLLRHARSLAELQAEIHRLSIPGLPAYRDRLAYDIRSTLHLDNPLKEKALTGLSALPGGEALCHGDYHPGNILLTARGPVVIDWMTASRGSPWTDVARTRLLLSVGPRASKQVTPLIRLLVDLYHRAYLKRYLGLRPDPASEVERWMPIIAAARLSENIIPERETLIRMVEEGLREWTTFMKSGPAVCVRFVFEKSQSVTPPYAYSYDPLNRLTGANSSTGDSYHYSYDAVGNRLTQTTLLAGIPLTTTYLYDDANRLESVNGITYTWDANGNLLDDGVNAYTYTSNKLSSISGENLNVAFQYRCNGLSSDQWGIVGCESDRVSQTVNGVTTDYVLDIASPLTQVLQDGTNTYVYGVDRIAQINNGIPEYFLTDGLGSVRQLVDSNGAVTMAKSYQPYGTETSSVGSGLSSYGFTGEMSDSYIKLIYLRSRWYDPASGRFPTKDSWQGDYSRPLSLNRWSYVEGNPINLVDPTGKFPEWCRSTSTKWGYARCVLDHYNLEPAGSIFFNGAAVKDVKGSPGCWSGPIQYRAGGYIEGYSWFGTAVWGGKEVVYSFARMERSEFTYIGGGLNDSVLGGGYALYAGFAEGLRSDLPLEDHYKGLAFVKNYGGDVPVALDIISFGLGVTESTSVSDWKLKTQSPYISVGGAMGVPVVDLGVGLVNYTPTGSPGFYQSSEGSMLVDMITGKYSPYPSQVNVTALYTIRALVAARTAKFFYVYQEMHDEEIRSGNNGN